MQEPPVSSGIVIQLAKVVGRFVLERWKLRQQLPGCTVCLPSRAQEASAQG